VFGNGLKGRAKTQGTQRRKMLLVSQRRKERKVKNVIGLAKAQRTQSKKCYWSRKGARNAKKKLILVWQTCKERKEEAGTLSLFGQSSGFSDIS
jgi:hypothetical protein